MTPSDFCHWLDGYLSAVKDDVGRDELDAVRLRLSRVDGMHSPRQLPVVTPVTFPSIAVDNWTTLGKMSAEANSLKPPR